MSKNLGYLFLALAVLATGCRLITSPTLNADTATQRKVTTDDCIPGIHDVLPLVSDLKLERHGNTVRFSARIAPRVPGVFEPIEEHYITRNGTPEYEDGRWYFTLYLRDSEGLVYSIFPASNTTEEVLAVRLPNSSWFHVPVVVAAGSVSFELPLSMFRYRQKLLYDATFTFSDVIDAGSYCSSGELYRGVTDLRPGQNKKLFDPHAVDEPVAVER